MNKLIENQFASIKHMSSLFYQALAKVCLLNLSDRRILGLRQEDFKDLFHVYDPIKPALSRGFFDKLRNC